jgi:hypothetical protein
MHELSNRLSQESILHKCDLLELRQRLLVAQLACLLFAQIRLFADPCLGRKYVLKVVDKLLYVVDELDELFSRKQRPLRFFRDVCLSLALQADLAHLLAKFGDVTQALNVSVDHDQVGRVACVFVCEVFCVGEEPDDVADKFFGLLELRLWQRTRRRLFARRQILAQPNSLTPS